VHKACTQRDYKRVSELSKAKETKNSPIDGEELKPQTQDQSNSIPQKVSRSLSKAVSLFSKEWLFRSRQIVHLRQEGIKFHTPKDFFPNQFHQPNNKFETRFWSTQTIPNEQNTKLHNNRAAPQ
jgi:hypothetical protein